MGNPLVLVERLAERARGEKALFRDTHDIAVDLDKALAAKVGQQAPYRDEKQRRE